MPRSVVSRRPQPYIVILGGGLLFSLPGNIFLTPPFIASDPHSQHRPLHIATSSHILNTDHCTSQPAPTMPHYLRARLSLCAFSNRRYRVFSPVAFPGPRPQSTHAGSTPGPDAGQVVSSLLYQRLVSEKNELYKKYEQASKEVKELYEKMIKKQEDMSKEMIKKQKDMFMKHEEWSNKCETYASKVADLKVWPS